MDVDEMIVELERAYKASTQGYWRRGETAHLTTIEETREWLGRMVDYHPEQPRLMMLAAMEDQSDPPEVLENVEEYVCPAVTGNGPKSEANAAFIELAHNWMPLLLEELKASRPFRPVAPR